MNVRPKARKPKGAHGSWAPVLLLSILNQGCFVGIFNSNKIGGAQGQQNMSGSTIESQSGGETASSTSLTPLNLSFTVFRVAGSNGGPGRSNGIGTAARFSSPTGGVIVGTDLYLTDSGNHVIRKMDLTTKAVTTYAGSEGLPGSTDGTGTAARFKYPSGITRVGNTLYVADSGSHTIRAIDTTAGGAVTTVVGQAGIFGNTNGIGAAATLNSPWGITTDGTTYLYITEPNTSRIRRIALADFSVINYAGRGLSSYSGTSGTLPGCSGGDNLGTNCCFNSPKGITYDAGFLYVADSTNTLIRRVTVDETDTNRVVTDFAGLINATGGTDGIGSAARFGLTNALTTDGTHLYATDFNYNCAIRRITIASRTVSTLAGSTACGGVDANGTSARISFNTNGLLPYGGNILVFDSGNHAVRQLGLLAGFPVTPIAGTMSQKGTTDGTSSNARFMSPLGITADMDRAFVTDYFNDFSNSSFHNAIRQIDLLTGAVTTLAGGSARGAIDGAGAAASFDQPEGLAVSGNSLYVADTENHTVRMIDIPSGLVSTIAGAASSAGSTDGVGAAARFFRPRGLAVDAENLYVADSRNQAIRKINLTSYAVTTLAGGNWGYMDGTGTSAEFVNPTCLALAGTKLYVTDRDAHTVRMVDTQTAVVTTLAGSPGITGKADGTGSSATFNTPYGIATDGTYAFVTDYQNHLLRKIDVQTGVVTTVAGDALGSENGSGTAASFQNPGHIASNGSVLFMSDTGNAAIRRIE